MEKKIRQEKGEIVNRPRNELVQRIKYLLSRKYFESILVTFTKIAIMIYE